MLNKIGKIISKLVEVLIIVFTTTTSASMLYFLYLETGWDSFLWLLVSFFCLVGFIAIGAVLVISIFEWQERRKLDG